MIVLCRWRNNRNYIADLACHKNGLQSSLQRAFEENRWYVWSRCYRRSLLERHPFIVGKLFEDMMFTPYVYLDAHTVYRLPEGGRNSRGRPINNVIQLDEGEKVSRWKQTINQMTVAYPDHFDKHL